MNSRIVARGPAWPVALWFCLALLSWSSLALAEGALTARTAEGRELGNFPLVRTTMRAEVSGQVATVTVDQRFHNSFSERIEAVYVFPLPADAAVDDMEMHLGARVVRARIERRAAAREAYETARNQGQTAAILEQERPNIFTFSVANIAPGGDIDVRVRFFASTHYEQGTHELALPMVVGPRYIPGAALPNVPTGTGVQPDTDRVGDASRISPAYVPPGTRSGHAVSVNVQLTANAEIERIEAPLHDIEVVRSAPDRAVINLRDKDEIPNRDFVLRWRVQAPALVASLVAHRPDPTRDGYFSLTLEPRHDAPVTEITAREIFFLLDTSGSMFGPPLDAVKSAVRRALASLSPTDAFQIIDFADQASSFAPLPLVASAENVARATAYLDALQSSGGTNQLAGIHAALTSPGDPMRLRYVVFMTDGYIGNESEVIGLARRELGTARIFSFGVGASVNRMLLDEVAVAGRGSAEYLLPTEGPEAQIERFYQRIARPYLTDVAVEFAGVTVSALSPREIPDVSALSPMSVYGRYHTPGTGRAIVRGRIAGHAFAREIAVTLPEREPANEAISRLWARNTITSLTREMHFDGSTEARVEEITGLALTHHLVSAYTSLVAIDDTAPAAGQNSAPRTVNQPAEAPVGVSLRQAGGQFVAPMSMAPNRSPQRYYAPSGGALGLMGSGYGGGGRGDATIGIGSIGTVGHGSGTGVGSGYGTGVGGLVGRSPGVPRVVAAAPSVQGALSSEVIRRIVQRNVVAVRQCYAAMLAANPTFAGLLGLRFVIGPDGSVIGVTIANNTTTPRSPQFEQCVMAAVRRWRFDPPANGGPITVTYPFAFRPDDGASVPAPPPARTPGH